MTSDGIDFNIARFLLDAFRRWFKDAWNSSNHNTFALDWGIY